MVLEKKIFKGFYHIWGWGQVTLMPIVKTGPKSNFSKILSLSLLSATLIKSQSEMKSLSFVCLC